ncbi:hypothetical protein H6G36_09500 [Anabaena minutissima FACHB-250]|nr:hypothetical protein [Anabaena minutissima FACHB-250]
MSLVANSTLNHSTRVVGNWGQGTGDRGQGTGDRGQGTGEKKAGGAGGEKYNAHSLPTYYSLLSTP